MKGLLSVFLFVSGCASYRTLSDDEMKLHQLSGEVTNAELCPTKFDDKSQRHQKTGACEWVRCREFDQRIKCQASKKPFND